MKSMLKNSIISEKDFAEISNKLVEKYNPIFGSLNCRETRTTA
jgi:hypothetical protein